MRIFIVFIICFVANLQSAAGQRNHAHSKGQMLDSLCNIYFNDAKQRKTIERNLLTDYRNDQEILAFLNVIKFAVRIGSDVSEEEIDAFSENVTNKFKAFPNVQARAFHTLGYHYFIGKFNYEKAFKAYVKLEKLLEIYDDKVITDYANYSANIVTAYYRFEDFEKAIKMAKRCLSMAQNRWYLYNTIGLCYKGLNGVDSSFLYFGKAVQEAKEKKMPAVYRSIALGNIGYNYYLLKNFKKAAPLIEIDLTEAIKLKDHGLIAGAAIPLADIYLAKKKWKKADTLLSLAREGIAKSGQNDRLEGFFPVKSRYYEYKGDAKLALAYRDSAIRAINRNDSVFNGLMVMRVQQRNDMEKIAEEKQKLDSYRKISQTRLWAISVVFLLFILGFFVVRKYRSRLEDDKKKIAELNRIIELRQHLSADMHDDIGSTLSSISIYTHSLIMQSQEGGQKSTLEKIKQNAQDVQESMSDIIWSVNPQMDTIEQMLSRMRAFGADIAEFAAIAFELETDENTSAGELTMAIRRNLYLIYKEAVNNAVKYSECKKITIHFKSNAQGFSMKIADDGKGFDSTIAYAGNGIVNMKRRAEEIKAKLVIFSKPDIGTSLELNLTSTVNS